MPCVVSNRVNCQRILTSFSSFEQANLGLCRDMLGKKRQDGDPWTQSIVLKTFIRSFNEIQSGLLSMITAVGSPTRRESAVLGYFCHLLVVLEHFGKQGAALWS